MEHIWVELLMVLRNEQFHTIIFSYLFLNHVLCGEAQYLLLNKLLLNIISYLYQHMCV